MRLLTFDLDDTLMWCGEDYTRAKQQFGEYIADRTDVNSDTAIDTLDRIDKENVEKHGLGMDRFPQSFADACEHFLDDPTEDQLDHVRQFGRNVFKTTEEYGERGFMDGAEELLQDLTTTDEFVCHLITAGDERVQQRKIDGLGLDRYFDETHIVPIGTKADCIESLMEKTGYGPDETYHIGNSLTSDVKSALDAGARAVYLPTHEWMDVDNAEYYRTHERVRIYESIAALSENSPDLFLNRTVA